MKDKFSAFAVAAAALFVALPAPADETCNSPYVTSLIKGQEDFVHVWTLGVKGLGNGNDKLVTIDANPKSGWPARRWASACCSSRPAWRPRPARPTA